MYRANWSAYRGTLSATEFPPNRTPSPRFNFVFPYRMVDAFAKRLRKIKSLPLISMSSAERNIPKNPTCTMIPHACATPQVTLTKQANAISKGKVRWEVGVLGVHFSASFNSADIQSFGQNSRKNFSVALNTRTSELGSWTACCPAK